MFKSYRRLLLTPLALAACSDETTGPSRPTPPRGIVVLHAVGALKGLTVGDTNSAGARVALPPEFDAGGMRLQSDTVLTASSSWGTNKLYVVALPGGAVREVEMPMNANAAGAVLTRGFQGSRVAVALRSTGRVALIAFDAAGMPTTTQLAGVGRCPSDLAMHAGALWVVDYNAACDADYRSLGDSRLIRVTSGAAARDTVALPGVSNASSIMVDGDVAYIASLGVADYSRFPAVTFVSPGAVTVVNLRTRAVLGRVALPAGTNGASLSRGEDGNFYVGAYLNTSFEQGVFRIDPRAMSGNSTASAPLRFLSTQGTPVACSGATADASGRRIYCVLNQGASQTAAVVVFDAATLTEVRRFNTGGTGAVGIALR